MIKATIQTLPYEVLTSIFGPLDRPSLVSLCFVCRFCNEAAMPILYKAASWDLSRQGVSWNTEDPLWPAFKRLPWLSSCVQSLAICIDLKPPTRSHNGSNTAPDWGKRYNQVLSRVTEEVQGLPSIRSLELFKRRWDDMDAFRINTRWFGQLMQSLSARIQDITLPEIPYNLTRSFQYLFHSRSLTVRGSVGSALRSPDFKLWAPRLKRVSLLFNSDLSELGGLFTALRCLRVEKCEDVEKLLEAIAASRELESLEVTITQPHFQSWLNARQKEIDLPALKHIRVRIDGAHTDQDIVHRGRKLFEYITSASRALLSASFDAKLFLRTCTTSEGFAIWLSHRHGRTLQTLYLGHLTLREEYIHQVLSYCPRLERIGLAQPWNQLDLFRPFASLRSTSSLKAICLTTTQPYSVHQVHAALVQNFPCIGHLLLRNTSAFYDQYTLWKGKWRFDSDLGTALRVIENVECSKKDWEDLVSHEQREFVDSLIL